MLPTKSEIPCPVLLLFMRVLSLSLAILFFEDQAEVMLIYNMIRGRKRSKLPGLDVATGLRGIVKTIVRPGSQEARPHLPKIFESRHYSVLGDAIKGRSPKGPKEVAHDGRYQSIITVYDYSHHCRRYSLSTSWLDAPRWARVRSITAHYRCRFLQT